MKLRRLQTKYRTFFSNFFLRNIVLTKWQADISFILKKNRIFIPLLLLFFAINSAHSQKKYQILLFPTSNAPIPEKNIRKLTSSAFDSISAIKELDKFINNQILKGYLSTNIDSIRFDSTYIKVYLFYSEKLFFSKLEYSLSTDIHDIKLKKEKKKNFYNYYQIPKNIEKIIQFYENNGFPFATVKINYLVDSIKNISVKLDIDKKNLITFDSLKIYNNFKISNIFLANYLQIIKNQKYSEKKFKEIENKLNQLEFLKLLRPPEVEFYQSTADIFLYTEKNNTNKFSGILGILPAKNEFENFSFTGDIELFLENLFGRADTWAFNWQKYNNLSQKLNLQFQLPYVFNQPFGFHTQLGIKKQDTTLLQYNLKMGLQYYYKSNNYIKLFFQKQGSSILNSEQTNTQNYSQNNINSFGTGIYYSSLDFPTNPRKGWLLKAEWASGQKKLESDSTILHSNLLGEFTGYFPFLKNFSFSSQIVAGLIKSNYLAENEIFKLGGLNSLKGFDEESILAQKYWGYNFELKYIFDTYSSFYFFYNQINYTYKALKDNPLGFGAGIKLETKAGIFSIAYALGKEMDFNIQIKNAKIHFGYTNKF